MKKFLMFALVLVLVGGLFAGCTPKEAPATDEEAPATEEEAPAMEEEAPAEEEEAAEEEAPAAEDFTVGLVTDIGGIDDKSFNQGTWEGIKMFADENGIETKYLQSASDADYIPNLYTFSDEELNLIIAPGFLFLEAMTEVSENNPDQNYLIIDSVVEDRDNVASAVFAEHEGSFLVGVAAALKAQEAGEDTVGFIGGMDFDLIQKFEAGFEAGVAAVDSEMTVLVEYAGSFSDTQIGQTLAAKMYDKGAYIIYHAAGGTGNGLIKEAKDRRTNGEDIWAIGVDKDQYADGIYDGEKSAVLTSMMKRVDVAAYDVSNKALNGNFPGGEVLVYDLTNNGVDIPKSNPNLSDEIVSSIVDFKDKVIAGEIEVPVLPNRLK